MTTDLRQRAAQAARDHVLAFPDNFEVTDAVLSVVAEHVEQRIDVLNEVWGAETACQEVVELKRLLRALREPRETRMLDNPISVI